MRYTLLLHVLAGAVGLFSGYIALYSRKGATLHRKSGMVFVYAMLAMGLLGAGIAAVMGGGEASVVGGLLTAYLVTTGLTTVRRPTPAIQRLNRVAALGAFLVGSASTAVGITLLANHKRTLHGIPFVIFFMFGSVALLSAVGDFRLLRGRVLSGSKRLARHLWRMCFALYIAAASYFLGPMRRIPEPLRIRPLLAVPVVLVLLTMAYWLWRVRDRKRGRRAAAEVTYGVV